MRKLVTWSLLSLALVVFAAPAFAQVPLSDCRIGVFAEPNGTGQTYLPTQNQPFTVYVVLKVEGLINAVAYDLLVPQLNQEIFLMSSTFGQGGIGINIASPGGYNIGLGECAVGFGDFPIVVATHTMLMPFETTSARTISLGPNMDADPEAPIFSTCLGQLFACTINSNLLLEAPVGTESTSLGAVKSLFAN